ncbi:ABC transporter permease [Rhodococcus sp. BP-149]|uniref:ABC transporter permease n=1 Tax=unclassified Rhodococcus (in: high G+C Gram-positive bacteria) TaxID=192944 RepID=UPI001C9AC506|nr:MULTISPECIES: ABC transporter permease [unclassified Rhodococcus (in: high G+C Gram-positive bacteria)]MBY6687184.1 ABC transporter permease [Rhodococcus sp. BP-288]MBY6694393.1 ABC transporter permease [Rhodococcus sp. BP-188]MBY6698102.1 ABC transporter permease [Rhodococcus sp. BP-285]MBY6704322.1 ABC transporter permease [Rhodococcus sp. BP-283]MBY6712971.1 ABC transporter permease [Rhodococcus sp. BP-160]
MSITIQPAPAADPLKPVAPDGGSLVEKILRMRSLGILGALVVLVAVTAATNSSFLSGQSVRDLMLAASIIAVLAVGQTVVMITKNIDLSVGSVLGLSAFAAGSVMKAGAPIVLGILAGIVVGTLCGVFNALLVRYGGVPALVVTLGTMYIFRGIAFFWAGGEQITADEMPRSFLDLGTAAVLGVPTLVIVAVVALVGAGVYLARYRSGRDLYAIGSNGHAAELAGIAVGKRTLGAFAFSGAMAGIAGVMFAARFGTVDAAAGTGYELNVIAACVVGGVAVVGGVGTVWGAALGALLLTTINSSLPVLQIDQFWQQAIVGALILVAIAADRIAAVRAAQQLRKRSAHVE